MTADKRQLVKDYWVRQWQQHADRCTELAERMASASQFKDVESVSKDALVQIERMRCDVQLLRHGAWHEMEAER